MCGGTSCASASVGAANNVMRTSDDKFHTGHSISEGKVLAVTRQRRKRILLCKTFASVRPESSSDYVVIVSAAVAAVARASAMQSGMPTPRKPAAEMKSPGWRPSCASMWPSGRRARPPAVGSSDSSDRRASTSAVRECRRIVVRSASAAFASTPDQFSTARRVARAAEKRAKQSLAFGRAMRPFRRDPRPGLMSILRRAVPRSRCR